MRKMNLPAAAAIVGLAVSTATTARAQLLSGDAVGALAGAGSGTLSGETAPVSGALSGSGGAAGALDGAIEVTRPNGGFVSRIGELGSSDRLIGVADRSMTATTGVGRRLSAAASGAGSFAGAASGRLSGAASRATAAASGAAGVAGEAAGSLTGSADGLDRLAGSASGAGGAEGSGAIASDIVGAAPEASPPSVDAAPPTPALDLAAPDLSGLDAPSAEHGPVLKELSGGASGSGAGSGSGLGAIDLAAPERSPAAGSVPQPGAGEAGLKDLDLGAAASGEKTVSKGAAAHGPRGGGVSVNGSGSGSAAAQGSASGDFR